jgi:hypothetical protein
MVEGETSTEEGGLVGLGSGINVWVTEDWYFLGKAMSGTKRNQSPSGRPSTLVVDLAELLSLLQVFVGTQ